jgi:hypothetical protein
MTTNAIQGFYEVGVQAFSGSWVGMIFASLLTLAIIGGISPPNFLPRSPNGRSYTVYSEAFP